MPTRGFGADSVYRAIATQLQDRINAGEWQPGERMPTEAALVAEFGVSRLTVREALAQLRRSGIVEVRQGSGAFVANPGPVLEISVDPGPRRIDEGSVHASIRSVVGGVSESVIAQTADRHDEAARLLGIGTTDIIRLDTVVGSGGDPFAVSSYWLDGTRFPDLAARWIADAPLSTVLREAYGVTLFYDWRSFTATSASDLEVEHLGAPPGAPLIVRAGVSVDADGTPVYYLRRRIRAERAEYVIRYR